MNRKICCLLVALALPAPALAQEKPSTAGPGVQPPSEAMAMPGLERQRRVQVYLPPGYADSGKHYPVLYMHDGQNVFDDRTSFVGEWGVDESLDELARTHGLELIVVAIEHGNEHRIGELKPWDDPKYGKGEADQYLRFIVEVVKPWADAKFRTRPGRADTGILGSSLGGLTSWYAAFKYPQVFGRIGVFSPSYWIAPQSFELVGKAPLPADTRMYQSIGGREGSDARDADEGVAHAQRMEQALRREQPGLQLRAVLRPEAEHNERAWREEFPVAARFLFGTD